MALLLCLMAAPLGAQSDEGDTHTLVEQLAHHYRLSRATLAADGAPAIEPGEAFTLLKGGAIGFAAASHEMEEVCPATFRAGVLHVEDGVLCSTAVPQSRKVFHPATRVCLTAITASAKNDTVSLYLIECRSGQRAVKDTYYAKLNIEFVRGTLRDATAARVEERIAQVLSNGGAARTSEQQTAHLQAEPAKKVQAPVQAPAQTASALPPIPPPTLPAQDNGAQPATEPAPPPAPEPDQPASPVQQPAPAAGHTARAATPSVGQTPEQVKAMLGEPEGVIDMGTKITYLYPGPMRVIFTNGKVSKIEQGANNQ